MFKNIELHQKIYFTILYLLYFIYFITFTKVYYINPIYLEIFETINIYYISLYLVYRFNPFSKIYFNNFDKQIIFSTGLLLLFSNTIMNFVKIYMLEKLNIKN